MAVVEYQQRSSWMRCTGAVAAMRFILIVSFAFILKCCAQVQRAHVRRRAAAGHGDLRHQR
jgi:hypothetical protein